DVHVFLQSGVDDHLRRLPQAGVDDFHAGIAQGTGNHLGAAVVTIQAGLSDEDADFLFSRHWSTAVPFLMRRAQKGTSTNPKPAATQSRSLTTTPSSSFDARSIHVREFRREKRKVVRPPRATF